MISKCASVWSVIKDWIFTFHKSLSVSILKLYISRSDLVWCPFYYKVPTPHQRRALNLKVYGLQFSCFYVLLTFCAVPFQVNVIFLHVDYFPKFLFNFHYSELWWIYSIFFFSAQTSVRFEVREFHKSIANWVLKYLTCSFQTDSKASVAKKKKFENLVIKKRMSSKQYNEFWTF